MWRDLMDELIDDLERVVPPEQQTAWGQMPSLVEITYWTDRILSPLTKADLDGTAKPVKSDLADDPGFQAHLRKWQDWRTRLDREAKRTPTSDTPLAGKSRASEK